MSSVSLPSSVLPNLLQNLVSQSPQLFSVLSTPQVQSALNKASPGDIAHLSDEALQLQQVGVLFGNAEGTQPAGLTSTPEAASNSMVQALENSYALPGTAASAASNSQVQEWETLFGITSLSPSINTLA